MMITQEQLAGPSPEWIAAYEADVGPRGIRNDGMTSIAPEPLFAWCCEQVLGSHAPSVVIPAMRGDTLGWRKVETLHAAIVEHRRDCEA